MRHIAVLLFSALAACAVNAPPPPRPEAVRVSGAHAPRPKPEDPDLYRICHPHSHMVAGSWAAYHQRSTLFGESDSRYALFDSVRIGDSTYVWFEGSTVAAGEDSSSAAVERTLFVETATGVDSTAAGERAIVLQPGTLPPVGLSGALLRLSRPHGLHEYVEACDSSLVVGWETVAVRAGSFRALHVRTSSGASEQWLTDSVPYGLVKAITVGGTTELTGYGTGATTAITATPLSVMTWMATITGTRAPDSAAPFDSTLARAAVATLCDSLHGQWFLRSGHPAPAMIELADIGGVLPGFLQVPLLLRVPRLRYPESLRAAGIEGDVDLVGIIDTTGRLEWTSVRFGSKSDSLFLGAVREAAFSSEYSPARMCGRPIPALVTQPFQFRLEKRHH